MQCYLIWYSKKKRVIGQHSIELGRKKSLHKGIGGSFSGSSFSVQSCFPRYDSSNVHPLTLWMLGVWQVNDL
jgi:hypothetical protein